MKYIKTFENHEFTIKKDIDELKNLLNNPKILFFWKEKMSDDLYDQEEATVSIFDETYKVHQSDYPNPIGLIIEEFPVDNCSEQGYGPGYMGTIEVIAELLNKIDTLGGIDIYLNANKYNI